MTSVFPPSNFAPRRSARCVATAGPPNATGDMTSSSLVSTDAKGKHILPPASQPPLA